MTQSFDQTKPVEFTDVQAAEVRNNLLSVYSCQAGSPIPTSALDGALWWDTVRFRLNNYIAGQTYSTLGVVNVKNVARISEDFFGSSLPSGWATSVPGGSSIDYPNDQQSAIRIALGSISGTAYVKLSKRFAHTGNNVPYFAARAKVDANGSHGCRMGFESTGTVFAGWFAGTYSTFRARVINASGTVGEVDSGVAVDNAYHWFRCVLGTYTTFQLDDGAPFSIYTPGLTNHWVGFTFDMIGQTTSIRNLDIDYTEIEYLRTNT